MTHFSAQLGWLDDIKNGNLSFLSSKSVAGITCWCNMYNVVIKQEIVITRPSASSGKTGSNEEKQHFRPVQKSIIIHS